MKIKTSKILAWVAMVVILVSLVLAFIFHLGWWVFVDIFFAFMMAFCHLLSVYMAKVKGISQQLDNAALICGVLMVVSIAINIFLI